MAMHSAHETEHDRHSNNNPVHHVIPPRIVIPQKTETLNRRISNLEAIDPGVFTGNILASFMALPGLVGFWPMSSVQRSTGNAYDLSGQGRTLTYNGNPAYTYYNGLIPYIDLDGTGDYLSRTDETDLDILGTESIYTTGAAGLTIGGWFWFDVLTASTNYGLMSKAVSAGQASYYLLVNTSTKLQIVVSNNGTDLIGGTGSSTVPVTGRWYFCVGRFVPSTSLDVYLNNEKTALVAGVPASLFNSTSAFEIGRVFASNLINGRAALCFLCANALGDDLINSLYEQSKVLLGF